MGRVQTPGEARLARCLLSAFLCAHMLIERETSGYEAGKHLLLLPFRQHGENLAARMYFHFRESTLKVLMPLQDMFETSALFDSRIDVHNCSATDDCKFKKIV